MVSLGIWVLPLCAVVPLQLDVIEKKLIKIVYFRGRLLAHNKVQIAVKGG